MDAIVSLLLNALRVARYNTGNAPAAVPQESILPIVFADLLLDTQERQRLLDTTLVAMQAGSTTGLLTVLSEVAREISAQSNDAAHTDRIQAIDHHLATLLAINHLARNGSRDQAAMTITSLDFFRYTSTLRIIGEPIDTILVSMPAADSGDIEVHLPGLSYAARRVTVIYRNQARYPRLKLATPTMSPYDDQPQQRTMWLQKSLPTYDLEVYTYKDRRMGYIQTRVLESLPPIPGHRLHLTFAPQVRTRFLVTEILDQDGAPSAQYIQITPAPGVAA